MESKVRSEKAIFSDLEKLCNSPGYAHTIAYFCFRDNTIKYIDQMSVQDVIDNYSTEKLVRTEISTMIGLMCRKKPNTGLPSPKTAQQYIEKTEELLQELHHSMMEPVRQSFNPAKIKATGFDLLRSGFMLREAIFYGGESAYNFQYRDLSLIRYRKDNDWFIGNKGFSIDEAHTVAQSISNIQNEKINSLIESQRGQHPNSWTFFSAFVFTIQEIIDESGIDISIVQAVIDAFILPDWLGENQFLTLDDFNPSNAYPIIKLNGLEYLLFQNYSFVEALYETPFFWFNNDPLYKNIAGKHRGEFTESFSRERLKIVFGENRVFSNVEVYKNKTRVGEIDVLVIFANRAIIIQAKSKKLTILSRKGNDNSIRSDFKKAVQEAYDQAFSCAEYLQNDKYNFIDANGDELNISREYKEIYPFCIVSDHYPSLSIQAREFLKYNVNKTIMPPFVTDVFLLDVMTEMLQSPLYFLSYINRRTNYVEKIISNHELTILSYHLRQNLWVEDDLTMMHLGEDIGADLDLAMMTRRDNAPGLSIPEGILTEYKGTIFDQIIHEIENREISGTIDLGFLLLSLGSHSIAHLNDGISKIVSLSKKDRLNHDLTLGLDKGETGLTIHCNFDNRSSAIPRLENHCALKKYSLKAKSWFGLCIDPDSLRIKFGVNLNYEWKQSNEMDEATKFFQKPQRLKPNQQINFTTKIRKKKKIGRNEKCHCGSGKKYKKCCLIIDKN